MERVKKQTVNELIAVTTEWKELTISYCKKDFGDKTRREVKHLSEQKGEELYEIAKSLERQCDELLHFCEIEDIANIVCRRNLQIPNRLEAFCKILELLGVEVV